MMLASLGPTHLRRTGEKWKTILLSNKAESEALRFWHFDSDGPKRRCGLLLAHSLKASSCTGMKVHTAWATCLTIYNICCQTWNITENITKLLSSLKHFLLSNPTWSCHVGTARWIENSNGVMRENEESDGRTKVRSQTTPGTASEPQITSLR